MTYPGTLPRFLACSSLMIWAFSTTGFPGATFSPKRYRTVVKNFDWVLMTWGGCLSTTRELQETIATWFKSYSFSWKRFCSVSVLINIDIEKQKIMRLYLWIRTCRSCLSLSWSSGIASPNSINSCLSLPFTPSSCSHLAEKYMNRNTYKPLKLVQHKV